MKISIVVPVYNAENFLEKSIGSVLSQTNSNWELILVNDGSTDRSAEICDYYSQKYKNIFVCLFARLLAFCLHVCILKNRK